MRTAPVDVITTSMKPKTDDKEEESETTRVLLSVTAVTPTHIVYFRKSHCCSRLTTAVKG